MIIRSIIICLSASLIATTVSAQGEVPFPFSAENGPFPEGSVALYAETKLIDETLTDEKLAAEGKVVRMYRKVCPEHRVGAGTNRRRTGAYIDCVLPLGAYVVRAQGHARNTLDNRSGLCRHSSDVQYNECAIGWSRFVGQPYRIGGNNNILRWAFENWKHNEERRAWIIVWYTY